MLANEEVVDGKSEVGGFPVVRKPMRQWMLRITAYAERLLQDLETIEWSNSLKEMQRNWIGRSEGAEVDFAIAECELRNSASQASAEREERASGSPSPPLEERAGERRPMTALDPAVPGNATGGCPTTVSGAPSDKNGLLSLPLSSKGGEGTGTLQKGIRVFTTRPDTLFGATYMVLAPEHKLVNAITTPAQRQAVEAYKAEVAKKSDLERTELAKEKTGVFTGGYAINPVNGEKIPIWIADYVLISYGTGAIMAVPGHDTRDFEFATKFNLPIVQVVEPPQGYRLARLRRRRHLGQLRQRRDLDQRSAHTRGQAEDHRLAGVQGAGQEDHQLQAPRLALQPSALLGRAVPDHLEDGAGWRFLPRSSA